MASSPPSNPIHYRLKLISNDLIALLAHLAITTLVHAVGHDWSCTLLSRLKYYHATSLAKLAYLTIALSPFAAKFDLHAVNTMTEQQFRYAAFGYQDFFMRDPGYAAALMAGRHERMEMLMFAENSEKLWREYFGKIGGLEMWLKKSHQDNEGEMISSITGGDLERRKSVFGYRPNESGLVGDVQSRSGYAGPLMYYLALNRDLNVEDEKCYRVKPEEYQIDKCVLQVVCEKDPIALPMMQIAMAKTYVQNPDQNLKVESLYSGHFVMYEEHERLNQVLEQFFS